MKIHLRQIQADGLHLEDEEECPISDLAATGVRCIGPLHYVLDLGISDGALWANGTLSQKVELSCVSCLARFEHTIAVPSFAVHIELTGPEQIDLTPYMREDILLNMPAYPHCDREGGRVCPGPAMPVQNAAEESDQAVPPPAWSELDKLKLK